MPWLDNSPLEQAQRLAVKKSSKRYLSQSMKLRLGQLPLVKLLMQWHQDFILPWQLTLRFNRIEAKMQHSPLEEPIVTALLSQLVQANKRLSDTDKNAGILARSTHLKSKLIARSYQDFVHSETAQVLTLPPAGNSHQHMLVKMNQFTREEANRGLPATVYWQLEQENIALNPASVAHAGANPFIIYLHTTSSRLFQLLSAKGYPLSHQDESVEISYKGFPLNPDSPWVCGMSLKMADFKALSNTNSPSFWQKPLAPSREGALMKHQKPFKECIRSLFFRTQEDYKEFKKTLRANQELLDFVSALESQQQIIISGHQPNEFTSPSPFQFCAS